VIEFLRTTACLLRVVISNIRRNRSTITTSAGPAKSTFPRAELDEPSQFTVISPTMAAPNRIVIDAAICHGKPVIRGTHVPVTVVMGSLAGGMTFDEVQREYDITADDIRAALRFGGELAEQESFHPPPVA